MGSNYFYLEFLTAWLTLLRDAGYQNPAIFALEYTLVPDERYPVQLEQTLAGYDHVCSIVKDPSRVCLAGDSAGATLQLSLLLHMSKLSEPGKRRPGFAVLISPWATLVTPKNRDTPSDYLNADSLHLYGRQFAGTQANLKDPLVSPGVCKDRDWWLRASPSGGYCFMYGSEEVFGPEVRDLIALLRRSGCAVRVREEPGQVHAWPVVSLFLADTQGERTKGLRDLTKVITQVIDPQPVQVSLPASHGHGQLYFVQPLLFFVSSSDCFFGFGKRFSYSFSYRYQVHCPTMAATKMQGRGPSKGNIELYSPTYFAACGLGGIIACGPTHTSVTPLDLVKCRRQVDPNIYTSNLSAWRSIFAREGLRGVFFGWAPTAVGYSFQGAGKYGFYEVFKYYYGEKLFPNANKTVVYLGASASAEFLADIALCPFEAVKVRMQTTLPPYASSLREGWSKVTAKEGFGGLYKGLYPLWGRQIPYTMVKFATFETTVNQIYKTLGKPKESYNALQQTGVSFLGGYIAGIGCAAISHPADVMVSKLNADRRPGESGGKAMSRIYGNIGFKGLWNGLPVRIAMIGTLTAFQWLIYDSFKVTLGFPTTGGH
ncbi:MAG: hypothetical protein Q9169_001329 [Polycauliona sp. 2 TL-2023]